MRWLILTLWAVLIITLFPLLLGMEVRDLAGLGLFTALIGLMVRLERESE
jgi:hypothetical protein